MAKKAAAGGKSRRKKVKRQVPRGICYIQATFNNTIISMTDMQGNVLGWSSSGLMGFKGSRKSTPHAAQMTAEDCVNKVRDYGLRSVEVRVSGPGSGREAAMRTLQVAGLQVTLIKDVTPIPHNGCRPPRRRRV